MKVMVIGNGGREYALEKTLRKSPFVSDVLRVPGDPKDIDSLLRLADEHSIDFTIPGPEAFLAKGIVDIFRQAGRIIFGPTQAAAQIESSKIYCKRLLKKYGVPAPDFWVFNDPESAKRFVRMRGVPMVVKADGLAGGKGVMVGADVEQTLLTIDRIMRPYPGPILLEELLQGPECSFMVLTDGQAVIPLPTVRDYKAAYPGGPNTGGMGCFAPIPEMTPKLEARILDSIIFRTLAALRKEGHPFQGVLYAGLMLTGQGPKVLEFNSRFGDPELQTILPLAGTDLFPLLHATTNGTCAYRVVQWKNQAVVCLVLASRGYPGTPEVGFPISGLEEAEQMEGVTIFHAGTRYENGGYYTTLGRVIDVTATGRNVKLASEKAYQAADYISFEGMWYHKGIGL